jgi:hypothetical protein
MSELTAGERRVEGAVKLLRMERFSEKLEAILFGVLHGVMASGSHYQRNTDFLQMVRQGDT